MQHGRTNPCMRARSGGASVDNWRGEYSYIHVHRLSKHSISKKINDAKQDIWIFARPIIEAGYATESAY